MFEPLSYLIGGSDLAIVTPNRVFELSYDAERGDTAYGNLRDEKGRFRSLVDANRHGQYAPYLPGDDITEDYGEFCPDPKHSGFMENIVRQVTRKKAVGCFRIEWDNPDTEGLHLDDVIKAHDYAFAQGLKTIAKNPLLVSDPERYVAHPSVDLVICEHASHQGSDSLAALRKAVNKPLLAVRFVAFIDGDENGEAWAQAIGRNIHNRGYRNMGVTISRHGEYNTVTDIVVPSQ